MSDTLGKRRILIAGDVIVDHHLYDGERPSPTSDGRRGVREVLQLGGAAILAEILAEALAKAALPWDAELGVVPPSLEEEPCGRHAYAVWKPFAKERAKGSKDEFEIEKVWRAELKMGYGNDDTSTADDRAYEISPSNATMADILVLDDAGYLFREPVHQASWRLPTKDQLPPEWIVLKMSRPIAQGELWHELITNYAERLVCVVSAGELRHECVAISSGLSWERTVVDVHEALSNNPTLRSLTQCRHLIIWFSTDGALWLDQKQDRVNARLIFDAMGAEDEWRAKRDGTVFGYSINMTTAVALGLAESLPVIDNENACAKLMTGAIGRGLAALRQLVEYGHGSLIGDLPTGFPVEPLAKILSVPTSQFTVTDVPWWKSGEPLDTPSWMIVESAQRRPIGEPRGPLVGVARRYVVNGAAALANYPQAKFGDLHTLDRFEIETLRSLYRMMTAFKQENRPKRPLSIGVFGPPGAGKSFGVKQISNELFGEDAWLEFNLSQFEDNDDLIGALHQVRDKVLSGIIPVAFWDEFDSESNKWLKDLLAPMQDGRFQQGQISHWVGKCVFVFAGGTSPTYHDFGAHEEDDLVDFKRKKGPDFHSRLDAYYDVLGPNQRERKNAEGKLDSDPNDVCFPLRRAILIRSNLKCKPDESLEFDPDLLDALLLAPKYIHGARSLEKLVAPLGVKIGQAIRRSSLPAKAVIGMHVDVNAFEELLKRNERFSRQKHVDELAARLHKNYLDTHEHSDPPVNQDLDKPFEHLEPVYKEMSRAAARRIPQLLAMVDMGISTEPDSEGTVDKNLVKTYLKEHLEMLAEEEHKGWVQQRKASGWRYGEARDDQKKRHPCIKVYAELDNKYKDNDRNNVLMIPELVGAAGYSIVWLGASNPTE